jgi:hypothetical protein
MQTWFVRTLLVGLLATGTQACGGSSANPDAPSGDPDAGLDAPTDPDAPTGEHLAEATIGASGGTIMTSTGVKVEVPEGALTSDVMITIDQVDNVAPPPDANVLGPTIQLGPEGLTFAQRVKVTLPWTGSDLPVVIAHRSAGGAWETLDYAGDHDETHVWGYTESFSPFVPVYYQGSPDTPIVLRNSEPVWPRALGLATPPPRVQLYGTGFRTDTVITLFKDGVTTAPATNVVLTHWGAAFEIPAAFTQTVGLLTIQAKNPAAAVGDAIAIYVIETPVLTSLTPTSMNTVDNPSSSMGDHYIPAGSGVVTVTATNLPSNLSEVCRVTFGVCFDIACIGGRVTDPVLTGAGFTFNVIGSQVTGEHEVQLYCGGVSSNKLMLTLVAPPT